MKQVIAPIERADFRIESCAVDPFMKNGFVLVCRRTQECALIDPGDEAAQLIARIDHEGWKPTSVFLTHAHIDHVSGIGEVRRRWNVPIYLHQEDAPLYQAAPQQAAMMGLTCSMPPPFDRPLQPGEEVRVGRLSLKVVHTPGHSPGGVCLVLGDIIFCGDAIFAGSIGRTDLPGGSYPLLIESIVERILPLGDDGVLLPGHGPATTVGRERASNPFLVGE